MRSINLISCENGGKSLVWRAITMYAALTVQILQKLCIKKLFRFKTSKNIITNKNKYCNNTQLTQVGGVS